MLELMLPRFEQAIMTRYLNNPRALEPDALVQLGHSIKDARNLARLQLHVRPDPKEAWRAARSLALPDHLICVAGSFFLAAEVRALIDQSGGQGG